MKKVLFALLAIIFLLPSCYPDVSSHTQGTDTTLGIQLANLDMGTFNITNVGLVDGVDVSGLAGAHTQNTDTILTTNGVTPLISAGVLVNDLKTDRWLSDVSNTFFGISAAGHGSMAAGATGNTGIGGTALHSLSTGYYNTAIGNLSQANTTSGIGNTSLGENSLGSMTTQNFNTAVGADSLWQNTGNYNVALGMNSGANNTGSNNVFLGYAAGEDSGADSNKLYISNSHDTTPLIYGDFATDMVIVNNTLVVNGVFNYGADAGTTDTYACTITGITAYTTGMNIYFKANTQNTGACSINVNTLGAIPLKIKGGTANPEDKWIVAGEMVHCVYDGTNFQILNPDAEP